MTLRTSLGRLWNGLCYRSRPRPLQILRATKAVPSGHPAVPDRHRQSEFYFPSALRLSLIAALAGGTAASAPEKDRPMMAFREMPSGSRVDAL